MADNNNVFGILKILADKFSGKAKALPAEKEEVETRTLVCFSILGQRMVVVLEEVAEILELQACTRLPRVRKWVKGVANVRGRLLPVVDFAEFLGGRLKTAPKYQRIVVLDSGDLYVGLVVDQVFGMKHFQVDNYSADAGDIPEVLRHCVEGSFTQDGEHWLLMRPPRLEQNEIFMDVAA